MFVMSEKGSAIFNFISEYEKIEPSPKLFNTFKGLKEFDKDGIKYWKITKLTEEEKKQEKEQKIKNKEWMKRRDIYVCKKVLENFTWEDFLKQCENSYDGVANYLIDQFHPCDDSTRQCRFDCKDILNCPYK